MFSRFIPRIRRNEQIAASLYGTIVAQARSPALYASIGVPDNVAGRFEMVVLHVVIVAHRLAAGSDAARAVGQGVFDHFCRDMDGSLREMGIGDLSVPKHMRRVGEAYFGRAGAYEPGLADGRADDLAKVMKRTIFADRGECTSEQALAAYALAAVRSLAAQEERDIIAGNLAFPDVSPFVREKIGR